MIEFFSLLYGYLQSTLVRFEETWLVQLGHGYQLARPSDQGK